MLRVGVLCKTLYCSDPGTAEEFLATRHFVANPRTSTSYSAWMVSGGCGPPAGYLILKRARVPLFYVCDSSTPEARINTLHIPIPST